jgi:hypothetical protein
MHRNSPSGRIAPVRGWHGEWRSRTQAGSLTLCEVCEIPGFVVVEMPRAARCASGFCVVFTGGYGDGFVVSSAAYYVDVLAHV